MQEGQKGNENREGKKKVKEKNAEREREWQATRF